MTFYPNSAHVPENVDTDLFVVRPLRAADNALDYAAVMASKELLQVASKGTWPREDFTPEENLRDLEEHEADHQARTSFTFTIVNLEETECLGCIYINPLDKLINRMPKVPIALAALPPYSTIVEFWMRPYCVELSMDRLLLKTLRAWFVQTWAFRCVLYPATHREQRQIQILRDAQLQLLITAQTHNSTLYIYT